MFLEGILAVSGQSGLFKLISTGKNNVLVESLQTKKRIPVFNTSLISRLENVSVFTYSEDLFLAQIFIKIFKQSNGEAIFKDKPASNSELLDFFESIMPEYNKERVYISDIKKVISWYNFLLEKEIITAESIKEAEEAEEAKQTEEIKETEQTEETEP